MTIDMRHATFQNALSQFVPKIYWITTWSRIYQKDYWHAMPKPLKKLYVIVWNDEFAKNNNELFSKVNLFPSPPHPYKWKMLSGQNL